MKLKFKTKLLYGIGCVADNAMYTLEGSFMLFFLTSVAGLKPGIAGLIMAVGSIWEVMCGPVAGYLSDNTLSRYGKRKPYLIFASAPVAITMWLLFTSFELPYTVKVIYFLIVMLLFQMTFSSFFVPYMAWGSDLTEDYDERTLLRSYAYVFNQVGMALGMVVPTVFVDLLMRHGFSVSLSWSAMGAFVGIISGASLLICALGIHESDDPEFVKPEDYDLRPDFSIFRTIITDYLRILKVRPVQFIVGTSLLYLVANTFFMSDRIYYFTYNAGLSAWHISSIMLLITVSGIVFTFLIVWLSMLTDRKIVFTAGIGITGLLMMAARFLPLGSFAGICIVCLIYSLGNTCYWQLMPSMLYDACELEELASGEKHSGQVISLQALSESLSVAIASQVLGLILEAGGFDAALEVQTERALSCISTCYSLIPGAAMLLVALLMLRYPVNAKRFKAVMKALVIKRSGGEVDMKQFRDIYGRKMTDED
jgi:GPH family glycoside/pentoside/hexuronide:cation symporter